MLSTSEFILNAVKNKHAIVIAIIGFIFTALPLFGIGLNTTISGYIFWSVVTLIACISFFVYLGLSSAVDEVVLLKSQKFNVGNLPNAIRLTKNDEDQGATIILKSNTDIKIDKDVVVSICLDNETHGQVELALGVILKHHVDGRIIIAANPKSSKLDVWTSILDSPERYYNSISITTCINRNYLNSDYLYKENYDVKALKAAAGDADTDGVNKL